MRRQRDDFGAFAIDEHAACFTGPLVRFEAPLLRPAQIDEDAAQRDLMLQRSGGRRTVPQIFIGDRHVGGFDDLYALDEAGDYHLATA